LKTVSILGCGWLGFPLAIDLTQQQYQVKASTTTPEKFLTLKKYDIIPFLISTKNSETNPSSLEDFLLCDVLIIAIPAKQNDKNYLSFLQNLIENKKLLQIKQIIFISSSSVYPDIEKNLTEEEYITAENTSKKIIFESEQLFLQTNLNILILRCSGLMGYDRVAGKYFANKTLDCKNAIVNYVHRDDIIAIINILIQKNIQTGIYNLCAPKHPTKEQVYVSNAQTHGFQKPIFKNTKTYKQRLIDGSLFCKEFNYSYKYQNPINFK